MFKSAKFFCSLFWIILISANASAQTSVNRANIKLGLKLLQTQIAENTDNFVVSATSVYTIAAMLAVGAEGQAQEELRQNILAPDGIQTPNITDSENTIHQSKAVEIYNSVWGDDFNRNYKSIIKNTLLAEVFSLPSTTDKINNWINKKTKGRIPSLLASDKTQPTDLYLVNTVYFKDKWLSPFDNENTKEMPFYSLNRSEPDNVMMMYQQEDASYYEDDKMQALRLIYKNGDTIQFFLPRENIDFVSFVKNLHAEDLNPEYTHKEDVEIYLPKLNISYKIDNMQELFQKMGVHKIFQPFGNPLPHMSSKPHYVRRIIHSANIKIDEEGTVASAATVTDILLLATESTDSYVFKADRPFLFMINNGLFIGAFTNPEGTDFKDDGTMPEDTEESGESFLSRIKNKLFGRRDTNNEDDSTEWKSLHYED